MSQKSNYIDYDQGYWSYVTLEIGHTVIRLPNWYDNPKGEENGNSN